jgi:hypothetical protein
MTEPQSEPSLRARLLPGAFFDGKSYLMLRLGNWIESFPLNDKVFPPVALIDSKTLPDGIQKSGVERAVAKLNKALGSGYRICCEFTD